MLARKQPFLGHKVSRHGLMMDPAKIAAVRNIKRPETKKDVRSFLGMAGYYRSFIIFFFDHCGSASCFDEEES